MMQRNDLNICCIWTPGLFFGQQISSWSIYIVVEHFPHPRMKSKRNKRFSADKSFFYPNENVRQNAHSSFNLPRITPKDCSRRQWPHRVNGSESAAHTAWQSKLKEYNIRKVISQVSSLRTLGSGQNLVINENLISCLKKYLRRFRTLIPTPTSSLTSRGFHMIRGLG